MNSIRHSQRCAGKLRLRLGIFMAVAKPQSLTGDDCPNIRQLRSLVADQDFHDHRLERAHASVAGKNFLVACGSGVLNLTQVQLAGKKSQPASDFIKSHSLIGVQLGVIAGTLA